MMFEILSVLKYMTNSGTYNETKNVMDTKITVLCVQTNRKKLKLIGKSKLKRRMPQIRISEN